MIRDWPLVEATLRAKLALGHPPPGGYSANGLKPALVAAAEELRKPYNTVANGVKNAERSGDWSWSAHVAPDPTPEFEAALAHTVALAKRDDEIKALRRELALARRSQVDTHIIRETILGLSAENIDVPAWLYNRQPQHGQPGLPVLHLTDWHYGEVVKAFGAAGNVYNPDIAERRVRRVIEGCIDLCFSHTPGPNGEAPSYPGIVVILGGDMTSGDIHDELRETNALTTYEAVLRTVSLICASLRLLRTAFDKIHVCATPGNHGRNGKPRAKLVCETNSDWLIYCLCQRELAGDPAITWAIDQGDDILLTIGRNTYCITHGDRMGVKGGDGIIGSIGPIMRGSIKIGAQKRSLGADFDVLAIGHWHQHIPIRSVRAGNCLIGPNEYSVGILRAPPSVPSQALWFEHPKRGITASYEIHAEDPSAFMRPRKVSRVFV